MNHFLDIGANVGNTFDWYLLKTNEYDGWHIWCFEPSVRHLSALRDRCREIMKNNEHNYSITICPFGLSNFTGYARIFETKDSLGDSLFETGYEQTVETLCGIIDMADFITKSIPEPGRMVVKIDTESCEVDIIESVLIYPSITSRINKMLVEFHDKTEAKKNGISEKLKYVNIPVEWWTL